MRGILLAILCCSTLVAADGPGERIEDAVARFERDIQRAFDVAKRGLDGFRDRHRGAVTRDIRGRLKRAEGADKAYLAYQLLRIEPTDRTALRVFDGGTPPFAPEGGHQAIGSIPPATDTELPLLALDWQHVPREQVVEATRSALERFSRAGKRRAAKAFYTTLLELRKEHRKLVAPVLRFYFPGKQTKGRSWVGPVDRYLLRHGLVTTDLATTPTDFPSRRRESLPMPLPNYRIELATVAGRGCELELHGAGRRSLRLAVEPDRIAVGSGEKRLVEHDGPARTVEVEVRQRQGLLRIDGRPVEDFRLEKSFAVERVVVAAGSHADLLRIRYLDDARLLAPEGEPAPEGDEPAESTVPPELLTARVTLSAEDTPVVELVQAIARTGEVPIRLGPSAEGFEDVPMTLVAEDMPLEQVLAWFERSLQIGHRYRDDHIELTWGE